jgi:CBS domain-containing protein
MKAGDVMTTGAATIRPDASLTDAARVMVEHHISGLPVVDRQERLVGIITEGDFLWPEQKPRLVGLLAEGAAKVASELNSRRVEDIMTRDPIAIGPETPLEQAVELMNHHNVKRLPVVAQGKVVGILSRANLMLALLRKAQAGS